MKRIRILFISVLTLLMLQGCITIEVNTLWNKKSSIRKAARYTNHIPLTVEQLRTMLSTPDSTHTKVVIMYDIGCSACRDCFQHYPNFLSQHDTTRTHIYFVQTTCNGFDRVDALFAKYGINTTLSYLLDDTPAFAATRDNDHRYVNIANYLCGRTDLTIPTGIPHYYIVDYDGSITVTQNILGLPTRICTPNGCK